MIEEIMDARQAAYTNVSNPPFAFQRQDRSRQITVAEKVGIEGHDDVYRMFELGGVYRMLDEEFKATANQHIGLLRDEAHRKLTEYDGFLHTNYDVVHTPIGNLVGMGVGALLEAAQYAKTLER